MTEQVKLKGMVISSMPVGEYDKRLVLLTTERGKITAFSRGSRRSKSPMLAATEPFASGEFILVPGRDAYTLVGANIFNYFMELRDDLTGACYGFYFLEFASYFARENIDGTLMLNLLYQTLKALVDKKVPARLVRKIYELKMLVLEGMYPQSFQCVHCGSEDELSGFSFGRSAIVCRRCMNKESGIRKLHPSTIYAMQFIISTSIEKLYSFTVNDEVLKDLENVMEHYLRFHVDRPMKSLEMLEIMEDF